ncbi:sugar ABC transporter permease [Corticibacter populi]|uniref:Sugar ABC transporter permease n=1 Tax=Corticibacter populi TaxID=1550736 RepID=A0A3M6QTI6_9BURK|nr:sugar ABC transporter permease [Corticibacter populi]RMX06345.1 sugar ABC transporter permease [Corticibacter populi]RZS32113.1 carbohydrate ABC transporter membrane protein 1 (CUT1 family) [Corticibacter populi]
MSSPTPSSPQRTLTAVYAWLLLLPAMLILLAFTHLPTITTLIDSFYSTPKGRRAASWVGLENYAVMAADPIFWKALFNNLWYALASIPLSIGLALLMALWVNEKLIGRGFLRLAFFTPTVLPMIAVANIWLFFFTPQYGLLERLMLALGFGSHNWLGDPSTALACVILVAVWKEAGLFMIFYLAALQSFNPSLREAAAIEGTPRWTFFWRVQWPLLMPTTLFVLVNSVINAFRTVDHLFVLTRGGPDNASTLLLYRLYEVGFKYWDTAGAAALTMVLVVLLVGVTLLQFFTVDKKVHYQ